MLIHQLIDFIRQRIQRSRDELNALVNLKIFSIRSVDYFYSLSLTGNRHRNVAQ